MSKTIYHLLGAALFFSIAFARGTEMPVKLLGADSCASSGCHGGGGTHQNQVLVWSLKDFHSQRPPATLATARSKQIADAMEIKDATADARCTTCHAPLRGVPENQRGEFFKVSEGVTCESCHSPAENWLRSHTRHDFTHADRVSAGMRDLENLYVRANSCVACHQTVAPEILRAGHPELIFELDGQSVAEPKHWRAEKNGNGAQAWLVGQAVALREMCWQLSQIELPKRSAETNLVERTYALAWLLRSATAESSAVQLFDQDFGSVQTWADNLAREQAEKSFPPAATSEYLSRLSQLAASFSDSKIHPSIHARRAERLVLALDRLLAAANNHKADAELGELFKLAQSVPDFDPAQFAVALDKFSKTLAAN